MASLFVTTGTLVVLIPSFRTRVTLSQDVFLELNWCWAVWPGAWHTVKRAVLWLNGACCLHQSRNCGPLLHTPEDVLLPMVFIKQVVNVFVVQYKHPVSSRHRPRTGHSQGQHRQRWHICSSYTEGKKWFNFYILKLMIVSTWYENRECTGSVPVVSATSWIFSLLCKKTEFIQVLWRLRYF